RMMISRPNSDNDSKDWLEAMDICEEGLGQNYTQLPDISGDESIGISNKSSQKRKFDMMETEINDICKNMETICINEYEDSNGTLSFKENEKQTKITKYKCKGHSGNEKLQEMICTKCPLSEDSLTYKEVQSAQHCDEKYIKEWITNCQCVNARDWAGMTLLHIACKYGYTTLLQLLLEHPEVHLNIEDVMSGYTPLMLARKSGHYSAVKMLTEHKGKCQITNRVNLLIENDITLMSEALLKNCQEHAWDEVARLLKNSTYYDKETLSKAIMISKSDSQWSIIRQILKLDVSFDMDLITLVFNDAVLENQHEFIAYLGSMYGKLNVFPKALLYCEEKCYWEIITTILNISLDIDTSVLKKILTTALYHQQWNIVHKVLQSDVKFSDLIVKEALDNAKLNGKLDLIEDISIRYSHIITDKVLIDATFHQQWTFILNLLKTKREFKKETLCHAFSEAFINLDKEIMQYFFTQNYSEELLDFKTLVIVFGKVFRNEEELSKNVAFLVEAKVKKIIYPFKENNSNNSLGSIWSHYLNGNIQVAEICKDSVIGYCRAERDGCPRLHATENIHWQISFTGNYWLNLTKQQSQYIEESFCNPGIDNCYPFINSLSPTLSTQEKGIKSLLGSENWVVDFKQNIITNYLLQCNTHYIKNMQHVFIRRLSVKDSDASQFQWYFRDNEDIWDKYGNISTHGKTSNITSDAIEQCYLNSKDSRFSFIFNSNQYVLEFRDMEQINKTTGMKRMVKRRPKKNLMLSLCIHNETIMPGDSNLTFNVNIPKGECMEIFEKLKHTLNNNCIFGSYIEIIESVEKINNTFLQRAHKLRLEMMETQYAGYCQVHTKKLLHGTKKEFVKKIINENFDWRLYGKSNGKAFGKGAYFTPNPKLALSYAPPDNDGKRYLIISSIIVGSMTVGCSGMEKPPINSATNLPYDTSVNNLKSPTIYVKYNKQEYCPEYVITMKKMSKQ
ncbi:unnamed protein product, partial [Meganyctiphanes norvegica]